MSKSASYAVGVHSADDGPGTPEIAQWCLTSLRSARERRDDGAVDVLLAPRRRAVPPEPTVEMQLLLQEVDHSALRSYSADPYTAYSPSRFNVLSCIKAVFNAASTLAIQNKVKEYNERENKLFLESVKHARRYNTSAIEAMFQVLGTQSGGMVLLQPFASKETSTEISGLSFPAQRSGGKRIRLVRYDPATMKGAVVVPTLEAGSADAMRSQSGSMRYPRINTLAETDYRVIAGHVDTLPDLLPRMIEKLKTRYFQPVAFDFIVGAAGATDTIHMPQLVNDATVKAMIHASRAYGIPFDIDQVLRQIRDDAHTNQEKYRQDARAAIRRLEHYITQGHAGAAGGPAAAGGGGAAITPAPFYNWARPRDAVEFLKWTLLDPGNYVLFYTKIVNDNDPPLQRHNKPDDWQPRESEELDAGDPVTPYGTADDDQEPTPDIHHRCYVASELQTLTTKVDNESIAAEPSEKDTQDDVFVTPNITFAPMYRFQVQAEGNERRFRLNYIKEGRLPDIQVGAETTDDIADRRGFDSGMKRFEFDMELRDLQGYRDEVRTFTKIILQTLFSKTPRPDPQKLPVVGTIDVSNGQRVTGFIGVPALPRTIREDAGYKSEMTMDVIATGPYEFYRSYPLWSDGGEVASAALFLWRHAVSRSTTPFSATADTSNLADVAAVLSITEPFPVYDERDSVVCDRLQKKVEDVLYPMFTEGSGKEAATLLHLIQVTGRVIHPGNTNFAQPFPLLTVQFDDAAIREQKNADGTVVPNKYQLYYTLGCQATVLLEAVVIGTMLLRVLQLNNTDPERGPNPVRHIPETHMVPTEIPLHRGDKEYKEYSFVNTAMRSGVYGLTNVFKSMSHPNGRINLDKYAAFFQTDNDMAKNKAARVVFGVEADVFGSGNPDPGRADVRTSAPGVYTPVESILGSPLARFDGEGGPTAFTVSVGMPAQIGELRTERKVYDDYLLAMMLSKVDNGAVVPITATDVETIDPKLGITIPVYRLDTGSGATELLCDQGGDVAAPNLMVVGFMTLDKLAYGVNVRDGDWVVKLVQYDMDDEANPPMQIMSYRSVVDSTLVNVYDGRFGQQTMRFDTGPSNRYRYFLGLHISATMQRALRRTSTAPLLGRVAGGAGTRNRRFLPLIELGNGLELFAFDQADWDRNMKAYRTDWKVPRPVQHTHFTANVAESEIHTQLSAGFQGFHFSRSDAAGRTTFAVAMNSKLREITEWYNTPVCPQLYGTEPRGMHFVYPSCYPDAMLMRLVLEGEQQGQSLTYTATGFHGRSDAVSMDALITPVVVNVRGPGLSALTTPCTIEYVYAKTSAFRVIESLLVRHLYQRLREHPKNLPKGHSVNCLAIYLLTRQRKRAPPIKTLRAIVRIDERFVPPVATLALQINDYEKIPKRTDKSRNTNAIAASLDGIHRSVYDLLYMV